jgi:hypothetical protein
MLCWMIKREELKEGNDECRAECLDWGIVLGVEGRSWRSKIMERMSGLNARLGGLVIIVVEADLFNQAIKYLENEVRF